MRFPLRPRILVADDHGIVVEGVRSLLASEFDLVGVACNGLELLRLARELNPDAMVVDIAMPLLNGLEATERLTQESAERRIVVMSGHDESSYMRAALRSGARAYVLKARAEQLTAALQAVIQGKTFFAALDLEQELAAKDQAGGSLLSEREREILKLLTEGKSAKEAAAVAGVSVRTVEFHKYNMMKKLGLKSSAELIRHAIREGIVQD
ncbi:MAG: response regulator [Acidobacteriota bacterium]|jgi:DNA-binding NarL/FixJ family response regulator